MARFRIPLWYWLTLAIALLSNGLAGQATWFTIGLMSSVSEFALAARSVEIAILPYFTMAVYTALGSGVSAYLWPIVVHFQQGCPDPPSEKVARHTVSAPFVVAAAGFLGWVSSAVFFPAFTLGSFGRWSGDLMSQQVLSPLVNGFLAAMISYLLVDGVFRALVVGQVFRHGRLGEVPGAVQLGVRGRLFVFLTAVAFVPLFTMLGLVRAAHERLGAGMPAEELLASLTAASQATFAIYLVLGVALTVIVARFLTRPLEKSAAALGRIRAGDLDVALQVDSGDEVGVLGDGVNDMVTALRDRERILQTFGRVVEPSVRDRLLSGRYESGGQVRNATVLFCDIRGFTTLSERASPDDVVDTLNEFFTVMTGWVRECGGFVDKFIGDALLVVFGLFDDASGPPVDGGAGAALRCAIGMRDRLDELNADRARRGHAPLAISVALHTGELVAGTIGAQDRHEYTVVGDTVNVAARLERISKDHDGATLVSAAALEAARDGGMDVAAEDLEDVEIPGRERTVRIYRLA